MEKSIEKIVEEILGTDEDLKQIYATICKRLPSRHLPLVACRARMAQEEKVKIEDPAPKVQDLLLATLLRVYNKSDIYLKYTDLMTKEFTNLFRDHRAPKIVLEEFFRKKYNISAGDIGRYRLATKKAVASTTRHRPVIPNTDKNTRALTF